MVAKDTEDVEEWNMMKKIWWFDLCNAADTKSEGRTGNCTGPSWNKGRESNMQKKDWYSEDIDKRYRDKASRIIVNNMWWTFLEYMKTVS